MIKLKHKLRLRDTSLAYSVGDNGYRIDYPLPRSLMFDAATDPMSVTDIILDLETLKQACHKALLVQIGYWIVFTVVVLGIGVLAVNTTLWLAALAPIVGFFTYDKVANLPDGLYADPDGNVVALRQQCLVTPEGSRVRIVKAH